MIILDICIYIIYFEGKNVLFKCIPKSSKPSVGYHGTQQGKEICEHCENVINNCGVVITIAELVAEVQRQNS